MDCSMLVAAHQSSLEEVIWDHSPIEPLCSKAMLAFWGHFVLHCKTSWKMWNRICLLLARLHLALKCRSVSNLLLPGFLDRRLSSLVDLVTRQMSAETPEGSWK
jgi:hypothetical protein